MIHSGIDLVDSRRIRKAQEQNPGRFAERICTQSELDLIAKHPRRDEKLAGIFALKEAFSKALGTGIGERLSFHDLQVSYLTTGQPQIKYVGSQFSKVKDTWSISCSISHEGSMVAAVVVLSGEVK